MQNIEYIMYSVFHTLIYTLYSSILISTLYSILKSMSIDTYCDLFIYILYSTFSHAFRGILLVCSTRHSMHHQYGMHVLVPALFYIFIADPNTHTHAHK